MIISYTGVLRGPVLIRSPVEPPLFARPPCFCGTCPNRKVSHVTVVNPDSRMKRVKRYAGTTLSSQTENTCYRGRTRDARDRRRLLMLLRMNFGGQNSKRLVASSRDGPLLNHELRMTQSRGSGTAESEIVDRCCYSLNQSYLVPE